MRIPAWTDSLKPQPEDLVNAIIARRGGKLLNLDLALLWSEPLARGWNTYLKAVRSELGTSRRLRELSICTVALVTHAEYEYAHHEPDYLMAGGTKASLDALRVYVANEEAEDATLGSLPEDEQLVVRYAVQMTRKVQVDEALFTSMKQCFDATQLVELTAAIATYNMVARFLVALEVQIESPA